MRIALYSIISRIFDSVVPPRASELIVRRLTLDELIALARGEDPLPYHDDSVKALVWEIKYRANAQAARLAGEYLAEVLLTVASEELGRPLLIPVPMHKSRRRLRGHNQTELLCGAAMHVLGKAGGADAFDYEPHILLRTRNTPVQQKLARHKRLTNISHSMAVTNATRIKDRVCIVVDDVSTTAATLTEAKRALREAGARKVICVALAQS